jgi:RNase H-like domain found in reverse transcriptase
MPCFGTRTRTSRFTFHIFTDASDLQLGSVIYQTDAPIAYFPRKLSNAQTRYQFCRYVTRKKITPLTHEITIHHHMYKCPAGMPLS